MESLNQVGKLQTPNILEAWEHSWQAYIADSLLLHTGMHALNYHPEPTSRSSTCTLIASSAKAFRKTFCSASVLVRKEGFDSREDILDAGDIGKP